MEKYCLISKSANSVWFLHPSSSISKKKYIWKEGIIGAATFFPITAFVIVQACNPIATMITIGGDTVKLD